MWNEKGGAKNTGLFATGVIVTYFVGLMCWPTSPRTPPVPYGVAQPTIESLQAAAETTSVAEPRTLSTEEIAARCDTAIAFVSGRHSFGTGFLVGPGVLATNAHVLSLERTEDLRVTFPAARNESMTAELVFEDPLRDLALLAVA